MQIGKGIKEIRISKQLKQSAVASMLHMSTTAYSDIERGKTINITLPRLQKIATVLQVTIIEIIEKMEIIERNDHPRHTIDELKQK
jgi:transcriptional regulator with XRE-family HTH domain